ncbi:sensor histidine kinase [Salinicola tamaricis]|uniref:sensor histidine kinase n=1 Tax=Salinicola tamaricis TaxID=1771309 RepID=UPI001F5CF07C|nr:ATP-binding protein [Salinicola tamaricis]
MFLEFRRAAAGLDREQRGLGLGLAIVDRIAAMLGHPITLRSRPGQGSAFSVRVPYACRAPRPATPAEVMPGNDSPGRRCGSSMTIRRCSKAARAAYGVGLSHRGWAVACRTTRGCR